MTPLDEPDMETAKLIELGLSEKLAHGLLPGVKRERELLYDMLVLCRAYR
ncbi:hypothetical protein [Nitrososphaera sp.]